ncbi:hypothetical protein [Longimicrobium sp.]|uniref:hypothetical protein n=1 Tax=Longimicrobium sp. TaxID=2029185 RepID=UPI002C75C46E|nr:hypothetical protein [Longimicrobium sp.]HSU12533.1 hypothetical protein [Longimicrobium sp.]
MTTLEAIGLIGGIASIAGFIYAIYYARSATRRKELQFDVTPAVPLATALSPDDEFSLSIRYQRKGAEEEIIDSAFVRFVRIANLGREPIRNSDIAPANPLRLEVHSPRVLDISGAGVRREVTNFRVVAPELRADGGTALIQFDFLDHLDGGLVKVLTTAPGGEIKVLGDVIGMPEGVKSASEAKSSGLLDIVGCSLGIVLQLAALVLTPLVYRWTTGSWDYVWLLVLPVLAVLLPALLVSVIASTIWPDSEPNFPTELAPPRWFFGRLRSSRMHLYPGDPDVYGWGVSIERNKLKEKSSSASKVPEDSTAGLDQSS